MFYLRKRLRSRPSRFVDGRANYYELGGARRRVFWGIWCEQIRRLLARRTDGSSLSETTAASSSSSSALYLLSSEIEVGDNRDASRKRPVFRCERVSGSQRFILISLSRVACRRIRGSRVSIYRPYCPVLMAVFAELLLADNTHTHTHTRRLIKFAFA